MESTIFYFSLVTSLLIHALIVVGLMYTNVNIGKKDVKEKELVFQLEIEKEVKDKPDDALKNSAASIRKLQSIKEQKSPAKPEILAKSQSFASDSLINKVDKDPINLALYKKQPSKILSSSGKREVAIPMFKSEKISNPKFLTYQQSIREKIKNRAYFYVDDPNFQNGEVYLSFVLLSNGQLKQLKIVDEKTAANDYLRGIGLRSIKESSPFPSFPVDLNYPELPFNVVISFKMGE